MDGDKGESKKASSSGGQGAGSRYADWEWDEDYKMYRRYNHDSKGWEWHEGAQEEGRESDPFDPAVGRSVHPDHGPDVQSAHGSRSGSKNEEEDCLSSLPQFQLATISLGDDLSHLLPPSPTFSHRLNSTE